MLHLVFYFSFKVFYFFHIQCYYNIIKLTEKLLQGDFMRNYILFSPNEDIASIAARQASSSSEYHLEIFTDTEKEKIIQKASSMQPGQYDLAIARGMMVDYIRSVSAIPIVEMRMTSQEMITLIQQALNILDKKHAKIAIIGSHKLFPDITFLSELFQCTINIFYISSSTGVEICVDEARANGYEIVIGGQSVCQYAYSIQMPHLNLSGSQDSLLEALRLARQICDASDMERKNRAEISVLLDYSVNGIIKVTPAGLISGMNRKAAEMLKLSSVSVDGKHITSVIPNLSASVLHQVVDLGISLHSLFITIGGSEYLCNFIPMTIDHYIDGAILSLQAIKTILSASSIVNRDLHQKPLRPQTAFQNLVCASSSMQAVIHQARIFSLSSSPLLIYGEKGTECEKLAECIHNESPRSNAPFVHVNCKSYSAGAQRSLLLGYLSNEEKKDVSLSPFSMSDKGSLLLENIDALSPDNQEFLNYYLSTDSIIDEYSNRIFIYDIRIIATSASDLFALVQEGRFSRELYFKLVSMSIYVPPLRQRKEDLAVYIRNYIKHFSSIHSRLNTISKEAEELLLSQPWYGNLPSVSSFCERLILFAPHKIIGKAYTAEQLALVFSHRPVTTPDTSTTDYSLHGEAAEISELLDKYRGNKTKVAEQLDISRSTLWRKMQKYNLT